jgi:hypothetical protein
VTEINEPTEAEERAFAHGLRTAFEVAAKASGPDEIRAIAAEYGIKIEESK